MNVKRFFFKYCSFFKMEIVFLTETKVFINIKTCLSKF